MSKCFNFWDENYNPITMEKRDPTVPKVQRVSSDTYYRDALDPRMYAHNYDRVNLAALNREFTFGQIHKRSGKTKELFFVIVREFNGYNLVDRIKRLTVDQIKQVEDHERRELAKYIRYREKNYYL